MRLCEFEGCGRKHAALGYCAQHYRQFKQGKDLLPIRFKYPESVSLEGRFIAQTEVDFETGCWNWTGRTSDDGYGVFSKGRTRYRTHRWSYERWVQPVPDVLVMDHLCRNILCANPDHLEPVPSEINVLRGESPPAKNKLKIVCVRGHFFNEENTYIRPDGDRDCRKCRSLAARRYRKRGKE